MIWVESEQAGITAADSSLALSMKLKNALWKCFSYLNIWQNYTETKLTNKLKQFVSSLPSMHAHTQRCETLSFVPTPQLKTETLSVNETLDISQVWLCLLQVVVKCAVHPLKHVPLGSATLEKPARVSHSP